jgi:hypothetical protein
VADLPIDLEAGLADRLVRVLDIESKIPRALQALGPISERDVALLDGGDGFRARQLAQLGGRVTSVASDGPGRIAAPDASADVLVTMWGAFTGAAGDEAAEAARVVRPGGRLLVLLDYGRDDIAQLRGDRPEYGLLSRRDGPLLRGGFKVRVLHCFWTFASIEEAGPLLGELFGAAGRAVATEMKRPRLSYNVAVYHRTLGTPA